MAFHARHPPAHLRHPRPAAGLGRGLAMLLMLAAGYALVAGQLVRLALMGQTELRVAVAEPVAAGVARPDLVDRRGRTLAIDVAAHSVFADPTALVDAEEAAERIAELFPDSDAAELRRALADRSRRFLWIRRGLTPRAAQAVLDLGLPGVGFRKELKRFYPAGAVVAHTLGQTDADNRALGGIERWLDDQGLTELAIAGARSRREPVRLTLDLAVQHAVREELLAAIRRFQAAAAAAVVLDARTGEIVAAASLPDSDPNIRGGGVPEERLDRVAGGTFELGSVLKLFTVAMAMDSGAALPARTYDAREPLEVGRWRIDDLHPQRRLLTAREVFQHSSNIGAARMALEAGVERQQEFLQRVGLLDPIRTQAGPVPAPQKPVRWGEVESITISYGHGLAVAPLQLAAAAAGLLNGGDQVSATFVAADPPDRPAVRSRVVSSDTSRRLRELMRLNVASPVGTGRRAEVPGYRVGGKTGTADMPGRGGYRSNAVISSFLGVFPADVPRYVTLVSIFEPKPSAETNGQVTAGVNAAPVTGLIVRRIAPLLDVEARPSPSSRGAGTGFDAHRDAKY